MPNPLESATLKIALSMLLTSSCPVWAQPNSEVSLQGAETSVRCSKLLSSEPDSSSANLHLVDKSGLKIQFLAENLKSIFLAPVSSWGRPNAKNLFTIAMRIQESDVQPFLNEFVKQANAKLNSNWQLVTDENKFRVADVFVARVHGPAYARHLPLQEGPVELEIDIAKSANEVNVANQLLAILLDQFHLSQYSAEFGHLAEYDLSTDDGRIAWGHAVFRDWLAGLSSDARGAIYLVSGPEYHDILPFLRTGKRDVQASMPTEKLLVYISALDRAINSATLPLSVTLFRATTEARALEVWTKLSSDKDAPVEPLVDRAYTFTSLDEDFVQHWGRNELRGKGIIMEIQADPGLKAGYVDRGTNYRDYAEIILARGQELIPIRAYTNPSGERRLVVKAR